MLQQILKDMWVDPEILNELDDTQKQTLFCRMREEQVRRWRVWDQQEGNRKCPRNDKRVTKKNVSFKQGQDGSEWVWVMGEHPDDKSIDEIMEEEARDVARRQAELEAQELRRTVEAELSELMDFNQKQIEALDKECIKEPEKIEDSMEIYCSVDELRERIKQMPIKQVPITNVELNNRFNQLQTKSYNMNINGKKAINFNFVNDKRDALQELTLNRPHRVAQRVALWEKTIIGERTCEILKTMQRKQMESAKEAEESALRQEKLWREQERRAKEAEFQIREIARRAREEHRRTSFVEPDTSERDHSPQNSPLRLSNTPSPPNSLETGLPRPPSQTAVLEWYRESEIKRNAGIERDGRIATWFHGLISRQEAESALAAESAGSFLVRLSERIWGYAISYRDTDRIKHYLVDASNNSYQFLGDNQLSHNTIGDLIHYHSREPITLVGGELLKRSCLSKRVSAQR